MRNSVCMFWDDNVCVLIYGKTILIKKFFGTMLTVFFIEMFIQYVQQTRCFVTVRSFCHTCNSLFANKLDKPSSCLLSTNSFSNWLLDQLLNPKSISVTVYTRWKCFSSGQRYVFFILSEATCATFHMSYKSIHSCRGCSFSCMESFHIKTCPTNYKTIKTDRPL